MKYCLSLFYHKVRNLFKWVTPAETPTEISPPGAALSLFLFFSKELPDRPHVPPAFPAHVYMFVELLRSERGGVRRGEGLGQKWAHCSQLQKSAFVASQSPTPAASLWKVTLMPSSNTGNLQG